MRRQSAMHVRILGPLSPCIPFCPIAPLPYEDPPPRSLSAPHLLAPYPHLTSSHPTRTSPPRSRTSPPRTPPAPHLLAPAPHLLAHVFLAASHARSAWAARVCDEAISQAHHEKALGLPHGKMTPYSPEELAARQLVFLDGWVKPLLKVAASIYPGVKGRLRAAQDCREVSSPPHWLRLQRLRSRYPLGIGTPWASGPWAPKTFVEPSV